MHQNLYYGEIAAHITDHLYQYPDRIMQIDRVLGASHYPEDTLHALIGNAAHIFATIQDLFDQETVNWSQALQIYSNDLVDFLLIGDKPRLIDMVDMVSKSIHAVL